MERINFKAGDRVQGKYGTVGCFTGTVHAVYMEKNSATTAQYKQVSIKRDDGETGSGQLIPGYGNGFAANEQPDGTWSYNLEHIQPTGKRTLNVGD